MSRVNATKRIGWALVLFLVIVVGGSADVPRGKRPVFPTLEPGVRQSATLRPTTEDGWYATYQFRVPEGLLGMKLMLSDATADLDLYVQMGSAPQSYA
ncbi:MAG: hypothetical protein E4H09_01745, partial [Spirochaetales bacterium]